MNLPLLVRLLCSVAYTTCTGTMGTDDCDRPLRAIDRALRGHTPNDPYLVVAYRALTNTMLGRYNRARGDIGRAMLYEWPANAQLHTLERIMA